MILDRDKNYVNMKTDEARRAKIKADLDRLLEETKGEIY